MLLRLNPSSPMSPQLHRVVYAAQAYAAAVKPGSASTPRIAGLIRAGPTSRPAERASSAAAATWSTARVHVPRHQDPRAAELVGDRSGTEALPVRKIQRHARAVSHRRKGMTSARRGSAVRNHSFSSCGRPDLVLRCGPVSPLVNAAYRNCWRLARQTPAF